MRHLLTITAVLFFIIGCEDNTPTIFKDIEGLTVYDPNETGVFLNDTIQDTVYYSFKKDGVFIKVRYNYGIVDANIELISKDSVLGEYFWDRDFLLMPPISGSTYFDFGKDYAKWKVVEKESDRIIVDAYNTNTNDFIAKWTFYIKKNK